MTCELKVHRIGPGSSIQDLGRAGQISLGLSRGGAADKRALIEGAVLLSQSEDKACLELASVGGEFEATEDVRIALTGAPMRTQIDGVQIAWNACHMLARGARLSIGGAKEGRYGYLHLGGGIDSQVHLGSRSVHLAAGLLNTVEVGDQLPIGRDTHVQETGFALPKDDRFDGGEIRVAASLQTHLFDDAVIARFEASEFTVSSRSNRMGVALCCPDISFLRSADGLNVISETVVPGDIQITGDGTPVVLLGECQTTGGYPRIGSVLPCDLAKVAQASQGTALRFRLIELEQAIAIELANRQSQADLSKARQALIRDPRTIPNLLSYQLISGVSAGTELSY